MDEDAGEPLAVRALIAPSRTAAAPESLEMPPKSRAQRNGAIRRRSTRPLAEAWSFGERSHRAAKTPAGSACRRHRSLISGAKKSGEKKKK